MESSAVDLTTYVRKPLAPAHVERLRAVGEIVTFAPGETLVAFGERYGNATLGPTQLTGEMSFLSGGTAQLTNRAVTPLTAIRVARPAMLQALADLPELSDIVVTVFAARRRRLIESGQAALTLIGPGADRTVRRIEAFAAQNRPIAPTRSAAPRRWSSPGAAACRPTVRRSCLGRALCSPTRRRVASRGASASTSRSRKDRCLTWSSSGAVPPGLRARSTPAPRGSARLS
jgi:CRP-like cAMP-binding protein